MQKLKGFTLIELLVVVGLFAILSSFALINLLKPQTKVSVDSTTTTLISDIKEQQLKAMAGDTDGTSTSLSHGIYFQSNRYTLFRGTSYQPAENSNFTVNLDTNLTFSSITFPSTQIVFTKRSGDITGFTAGSNSVTIRNVLSGEQKTITINRYGVVTEN